MNNQFNMSQQYQYCSEDNHLLDCINKNIVCKTSLQVILAAYAAWLGSDGVLSIFMSIKEGLPPLCRGLGKAQEEIALEDC